MDGQNTIGDSVHVPIFVDVKEVNEELSSVWEDITA
jgi:hypothetical protein